MAGSNIFRQSFCCWPIFHRRGELTANRVSFVIKPTAVLLGILLLRGLREPQRATQPTLTGAFRTVRQFVAAQGASFPGSGG